MRFLKAVFIVLSALGLLAVMVPQEASAKDGVPHIQGFESKIADLGNGVLMHYWIGGHGNPVILLHGWPETGYAWRFIAPRLVSAGFLVIVPDLRGFGDSSRPETGYDRNTMAQDVRILTHNVLGIGTVSLVGHDWGGSTAAAWAIAYPNEVRRLVVIEALPRGPWSKPEPWFYAFHRAVGFPEEMTAGRERIYLTWYYRNFAARPDAISEADIDIYLRTYGSPDGMRPGFELVRALPSDVASNALAAGHPGTVPSLAVGGELGMGTTVAENLAPLFPTVQSVTIARSGHFIPEEAPDKLVQVLLTFLPSPRGNEIVQAVGKTHAHE